MFRSVYRYSDRASGLDGERCSIICARSNGEVLVKFINPNAIADVKDVSIRSLDRLWHQEIPQCNGNHDLPRCHDPQCWHRDPMCDESVSRYREAVTKIPYSIMPPPEGALSPVYSPGEGLKPSEMLLIEEAANQPKEKPVEWQTTIYINGEPVNFFAEKEPNYTEDLRWFYSLGIDPCDFERLAEIWREGQDMGCSCHVNPPCTACVEFGYSISLKEFIELNAESIREDNPNQEMINRDDEPWPINFKLEPMRLDVDGYSGFGIKALDGRSYYESKSKEGYSLLEKYRSRSHDDHKERDVVYEETRRRIPEHTASFAGEGDPHASMLGGRFGGENE